MKKGDARRSELLATAEKLFYTKGYEGTSVQDILDAMNFSKGGFYHHFDSKLAVLEAICQQRAQETCEAAGHAVMLSEGDAVQKLNALLSASTLWQSDNPGFVSLLIQVAYREDGALMREKMKRCQLEYMQGPMEQVLSEGAASGVFFVNDAETCAGLVLRLYMQFTDEIAFLLNQESSEEQLGEIMVRKLRAYREAIERSLIAPYGSIVLFEIKDLQLLAQRTLLSRNRRRADALLAK